MKLSIVIATYYRKDGNSLKYLTRALDSVFNQTHQDFKIYLIGDKYEHENEILSLLNNYDNRIYFKNLTIAKERDVYKDSRIIWAYGGVNAVNEGIDISLIDNNYYICHLDHDDYWDINHLSLINDCIEKTNSDWICTKSVYINQEFPKIISDSLYINFLPKPERLIHSSVCMNFKTIPLKYKNIFEETGEIGLPSDAELWKRCASFIENNNLKSTLINKITCFHLEEGYERNNK